MPNWSIATANLVENLISAMSEGLLLDTNIISEMSRQEPHPAVASLFAGRRHDLFISVISLGELRRGEARLRTRDATRAARIDLWLRSVEVELADRVIQVTTEVAYRWGEITSQRSRPLADALLAATALVHNLSLVTRNTKDFDGLGLSVINPWDD